MKRPLRSTTYEDAVLWAQTLLSQLAETEEYAAVLAHAEELGVTVTASPRHTYTEDYAYAYVPDPDATGALPFGYAMELWFDITRGGHVLCTGGAAPVQCSYSVRAIEQSSFFVFHRLIFHPLDYILERSQICAMLEEYLDTLSEEGMTASPFVSDALCPTSPRGEVGVLTREQVGDGAYIELARTAYDGTFGADTSLYFSADAFFPYRLLLLGLTGRSGDFEGAALPLDRETAERFAELLDAMPAAMRHGHTFTDVYTALCEESILTPTPRAEQLLDALTVTRRTAFLSDCATLAAFLQEQLGADAPITLIW